MTQSNPNPSTSSEDISKADILKADISKLHSEINQYLNQRLTITTTAITLFGVVMGWVVANKGSTPNNSSNLLNLPSLLMIFLTLLLLYSQAMVMQQHVLSTYLESTWMSDWEKKLSSFFESRYKLLTFAKDFWA